MRGAAPLRLASAWSHGLWLGLWPWLWLAVAGCGCGCGCGCLWLWLWLAVSVVVAGYCWLWLAVAVSGCGRVWLWLCLAVAVAAWLWLWLVAAGYDYGWLWLRLAMAMGNAYIMRACKHQCILASRWVYMSLLSLDVAYRAVLKSVDSVFPKLGIAACGAPWSSLCNERIGIPRSAWPPSRP